MLGIMQMQEVDALDPQRLEALLERAPRLRRVEAIGLKIAVELGGDDEARGRPPRSRMTAPIRSSLRPTP